MKEQKFLQGGLFALNIVSFFRTVVFVLVVATGIHSQPASAFDYQSLTYDEVAQELKAPEPTEKELICLAHNIYFEARGEDHIGQQAVAFVTINRTKSSKFPEDLCEVVYQKIKGVCQFAWVCNKGLRVLDWTAFEQAKIVAYKVLTMYNELIDPTKGALFFSARSVKNPRRLTTVIGRHAFYR